MSDAEVLDDDERTPLAAQADRQQPEWTASLPRVAAGRRVQTSSWLPPTVALGILVVIAALHWWTRPYHEPDDEAIAVAFAEGPPRRLSLANALRLALLPDALDQPGGGQRVRSLPANLTTRVDRWRPSSAPLTLYTARADRRLSFTEPVVATIATAPLGGPPFSPMTNHARYCLARGYDYAVRTQGYAQFSGVYIMWHKILLLRHLLSLGYGLVMWTDYDAIFTDCHLPLTAVLNAGLRASGGWLPESRLPSVYFVGDLNTALNAGTLAVRRTDFGDGFLRSAWDQWGAWPPCAGGAEEAHCVAAVSRFMCGQRNTQPSDQGALMLALARGVPNCTAALVRPCVSASDCESVMRSLSAHSRQHVRCLAQEAINAYPEKTGYRSVRPSCEAYGGDCAARDASWQAVARAIWKRGRFRLHAAGSTTRKAETMIAALRGVRRGWRKSPEMLCSVPPTVHDYFAGESVPREVTELATAGDVAIV